MKFRTALIILVILCAINYPIASMLSVPTDPAATSGLLKEKIKFKTGSGDDKEDILVVKYDAASLSTKLEINMDDVCCELKAKYDVKHENKLKYKETVDDNEKAVVAIVKYSKGNSFKLVDENDKLLWKVKIDYDKIKICDNEEGKNYFQIKKNKKGKYKIYDQGEEEKNFGVIKYKEGKLKVKSVVGEEEKEDLYSCKELYKVCFAPGALMFNKIPVKERAIIVTELLRREY